MSFVKIKSIKEGNRDLLGIKYNLILSNGIFLNLRNSQIVFVMNQYNEKTYKKVSSLKTNDKLYYSSLLG